MKAKKEAGRKRPGAFLLYLTEDQRARLEAYRAKLELDEGARFGIPRRVSTADVVRLALERLFASPAGAKPVKRPEAGTLDGAALKAAREKAGESQAFFAKRLGVSQPSLSSWESGKRAVPAERVEELRRVLGLEA